MALINRVSRLFRADMHAVLDRIEEPDLLLKQAIREMEAAFAEDAQRGRLLQHELNQIDRRLQGLQEKLAQMDEELDICFQQGREALAKQLIRKKLELACFTKQLAQRQTLLQQTLADLSRRQHENHTRLESLRQKAELLTANAPDDTAGTTGEPAGLRIDEADVEIAFLREQQKRGGA